MKRQLDKQEKEKTLKGIAVAEDRVKRIEESVNFNRLTMDFQKAQDTYQEAVKPYLRKRKKEEDDKIMGTLTQNINMEKDTIRNLQDQIKDGVEIKTPGGK